MNYLHTAERECGAYRIVFVSVPSSNSRPQLLFLLVYIFNLFSYIFPPRCFNKRRTTESDLSTHVRRQLIALSSVTQRQPCLISPFIPKPYVDSHSRANFCILFGGSLHPCHPEALFVSLSPKSNLKPQPKFLTPNIIWPDLTP